jgi:hypothetical protein
MVEQSNAQDQSLNEKAEARPAVRERGEESLHGSPSGSVPPSERPGNV